MTVATLHPQLETLNYPNQGVRRGADPETGAGPDAKGLLRSSGSKASWLSGVSSAYFESGSPLVVNSLSQCMPVDFFPGCQGQQEGA